MATIKPFKGIRPPKELIEQIESRPYDVLNSEEAREEAKGNEKSLYHIIKPEIDFEVGTSEYEKLQEIPRKRLVSARRKRPLLYLCTDNEQQNSIWFSCRSLCK